MFLSYLILLNLIIIKETNGLKILQIVPGFTNSHVLFNYRVAETLTKLGHQVKLWTQMEMSMVVAGDLSIPKGVTEFRVPIEFSDKMKTEGLAVGGFRCLFSSLIRSNFGFEMISTWVPKWNIQPGLFHGPGQPRSAGPFILGPGPFRARI